nr:PEP/pyruvate-binding domain-containing protein [Nocardioides piscis]
MPPWILIPEGEPCDVAALTGLDGDLFAVRSSANCEDGALNSFAGIFESRLCVPRSEVTDAVTAVRASAHTERCKVYLDQVGLSSTQISMDVIVQRMLSARIAGVAFSRHPLRPDSGTLIEVVHGLGETLVGGQSHGDQIELDAKGNTLTYQVAHQSHRLVAGPVRPVREPVPLLEQSAMKMTAGEIAEIDALVRALRTRMGCEIDVEFAYAKNDLYLLQARPLTGSTS